MNLYSFAHAKSVAIVRSCLTLPIKNQTAGVAPNVEPVALKAWTSVLAVGPETLMAT